MTSTSAACRTSQPDFDLPGDSFFRHLFASMRCGIITIDQEGRITTINDLARNILELKASKIVGVPCADALRPHPKLAGYLVESFRMKNQLNRAEMEIRLKDERKRTIGFSLPLIRNDTGKVVGAALLFRDLTQIEHHEEQEKLKERLAALGQMAAGMAHEIRNPLGGIELTASLLRRRLSSRQEDSSLVDKIISEVKRLNRTVVDSLEYVKPLHLDLKPTALNGVIEDAVRRASESMGRKDIQLTLRLAEPNPVTWIDPDRVRDALINLLQNAFEAITTKGFVRVETRREALPYTLRSEPDDEDGRPRGGWFNSHAVIKITDSGKGITEKSGERLFYPFFTTKQSGSGVGLPLAKKIIEGHGGIIDFESEVGRGTTFILKIPLVTQTNGLPGSRAISESETK